MTVLALGPNGRDAKFYLNTDIQFVTAPDRLGLVPKLVNPAVYLGGKNDGKPVEDNTQPSNTTTIINWGCLSVRKGLVRIETNPILHRTAIVATPTLLAVGDHELFIVIRAQRAVDLNLDWLVKIYIEN